MPDKGANKGHAEEMAFHPLGSRMVTRSGPFFDLNTLATGCSIDLGGMGMRQGNSSISPDRL